MSFTRLRYHIILPTYRREPTITAERRLVLFPLLIGIAENLGGAIIELDGVENHIHMLVALPARLALASFLAQLKSRSSARMGYGFYWCSEYGALTVDPHNTSRLLNYIRNQKSHHSKNTIIDRYERTNRQF